MTTKEKLLQEFGCAIDAILGDDADKEYDADESLEKGYITAIAKKVIWYLDLD